MGDSGSRRNFFSGALNEAKHFGGNFSGVPQYFLDDLAAIPIDDLLRLVPAIDSDQIAYDDDGVVKINSKGERQILFPVESMDFRILQLFDGEKCLADIASESVDSARIASPSRARSIVREFFLRLTDLGICFPVNC